MKTTLKCIVLFSLACLILCPAAAGDKKKQPTKPTKARKVAPKPKNRKEVLDMAAGSIHNVEWERNQKSGQLNAIVKDGNITDYKSPLELMNRAGAKPKSAANKSTTTNIGREPISLGHLADEISDRLGKNIGKSSYAQLTQLVSEVKKEMSRGRKVTVGFEDSIRLLEADDIGLLVSYTGQSGEMINSYFAVTGKDLKGQQIFTWKTFPAPYAPNLSSILIIDASHVASNDWLYRVTPRLDTDPDLKPYCSPVLEGTSGGTFSRHCDVAGWELTTKEVHMGYGRAVVDISMTINNDTLDIEVKEHHYRLNTKELNDERSIRGRCVFSHGSLVSVKETMKQWFPYGY